MGNLTKGAEVKVIKTQGSFVGKIEDVRTVGDETWYDVKNNHDGSMHECTPQQAIEYTAEMKKADEEAQQAKKNKTEETKTAEEE